MGNIVTEVMTLVNHNQIIVFPVQCRQIDCPGETFITAQVRMIQHIIVESVSCKDIPLIKSVFVRKGDDVKEMTKDLNYPLITKPVSEGSSFGMTKVNTPDELEKAYEDAIKYNDDVLLVGIIIYV